MKYLFLTAIVALFAVGCNNSGPDTSNSPAGTNSMPSASTNSPVMTNAPVATNSVSTNQ